MDEHIFLYLKRGKGGIIGPPTLSTTTNDKKPNCVSLERKKEMSSRQEGFVKSNICQTNLISFCDRAADPMRRE